MFLKIPDEFLNTVVQWVSPPFPCPFGSQPEWGIMTMFISTSRASSIMARFRSYKKLVSILLRVINRLLLHIIQELINISVTIWLTSQDERFHSTPVTSSLTSLSVVFLRSLQKSVNSIEARSFKYFNSRISSDWRDNCVYTWLMQLFLRHS